MPADDLKDLLAALPLNAEVELTVSKNEWGQRVTTVRTASRTVVLDDDVTLRVGRALPMLPFRRKADA